MIETNEMKEMAVDFSEALSKSRLLPKVKNYKLEPYLAMSVAQFGGPQSLESFGNKEDADTFAETFCREQGSHVIVAKVTKQFKPYTNYEVEEID